MEKYLPLGCQIILIFTLTLLPGHSVSEDMNDQLQWIVGNWVRQSDHSTTYETWRRLSEGTHEGESYRVSRVGGDTVFTESLLMAGMGGEVFYVAKVGENPYPVPFRIASLKEGNVVF